MLYLPSPHPNIRAISTNSIRYNAVQKTRISLNENHYAGFAILITLFYIHTTVNESLWISFIIQSRGDSSDHIEWK